MQTAGLSPHDRRGSASGRAIVAAVCLCLAVLFPGIAPCAEPQPEIKTIETRPGVTMNLLLLKPAEATKRMLVLFPGGRGAGHFGQRNGRIWMGRNFLLRAAPDFVRKGFAVAVVDTPSDRRLGMEDSFRTSAEHRDDIDKAVRFLAGQGYEALYLVGTSRGTISIAYLAHALQNERIKGVVLTSSMGYQRFLSWQPLNKVTIPVLIVHHKHDGCAVTSYADASTLKEKFTQSPGVDFIGLEGGSPPQSDACEAMSAHGFLGIEERAVEIICTWIAKTPPTLAP